MTRYNVNTKTSGESPNIDAFLQELLAICKKYDLSISHEDYEGSFLIEPFTPNNWDWLLNAYDNTTDE